MKALTLLAATEFRLMTREWPTMVFAFAFPALLMVILAGVFGTEASPEYGGVTPSDYYVADYVAVPLGALALIGLPVMIASYRERRILRRFEAAGIPTATMIAAQTVVTAAMVILGAAVVLAVAAPTYGIPTVQDPVGVVTGFIVGTVTMIAIGAVLGMLAGTARSAQALGLLAFFPMWLLGAGGPPRTVMPDIMAGISEYHPLGHVAEAIRQSWLDNGSATENLQALGLWFLAAAILIVLLLRCPGPRCQRQQTHHAADAAGLESKTQS